MPRKKEFHPILSYDAYKGKMERWLRGLSPNPASGDKYAEDLANFYMERFAFWHNVRLVVRGICEEYGIRGNYIAMYMAAVQLYIKEVVGKRASPDTTFEYVKAIFPEIDDGVFIDMLSRLSPMAGAGVPKKKAGSPVEAPKPGITAPPTP